MNILIVEDEIRIADFVRRGLGAEGFRVTHELTAQAGLERIDSKEFDVILLDIMLPGMSGLDMCRELRARRNRTPILILSALDETSQRVEGLRLGADDYLVKPFEFDELIARLEALHRRSHDSAPRPAIDRRLAAGSIALDLDSFRVTNCGREVELTEKEREILILLMSNQDRVLSRERILNTVWSADADPLTNVVDVYIGRLRKKFGFSPSELKTIRGVGFRFTPAT
jgi:DNA-binding response OmpR family regulator